ncbi:hypothetical protein [Xanthomonas axonopodis]
MQTENYAGDLDLIFVELPPVGDATLSCSQHEPQSSIVRLPTQNLLIAGAKVRASLFIIEIMSYFIFGWKAGFGILFQANGSAWQGLLAALPFTIYVLAHAASCCPNG